MRRYSLEYNPILQYYAQIKSKKVTVSKAIEKWYRYLVWHIQNPDEYFYSPKRANHIIEFAENFCKFSKGATRRTAGSSGTLGKGTPGSSLWLC